MSLLLRAMLEKKEELAAVGFLARNGSAATIQLGSDMKVYSIVVLHDGGTELTKNHVRIQSIGEDFGDYIGTENRGAVANQIVPDISAEGLSTWREKDRRRKTWRREEGRSGRLTIPRHE